VSARRRSAGNGLKRRQRGVLAVAGCAVLLLASLSFVTWRQPRGVEMESALRSLEAERAIAEAERVASLRRIEELRGRVRIMRVARERLGMHLPTDDEIVFLPVAAGAPTSPGAR